MNKTSPMPRLARRKHELAMRGMLWKTMDGYYDNDEPFIYRLNDNGSGPSLLIKVCAERGWRMYQGYSSSEERWNLWWRTSSFPAGCYKTLGDWQFMNHIPKGGSICRKDGLSRLLRCMRRVYGSIYDFSPPCFHLPLEYAKLVSECSRLRRTEEDSGSNVVWIHKPVAQSQGRGIFLFRSICEMRCGSSAVVQRYIERPLLIAGYKFDLRLYVCVPGYRPLTAYLYAEGLARFGTDKYTLSDIHNPYRHLTNSSLNKSGPRYAECKDRIGSGCKWTLKQVRRALTGRWGAAEWLVWQRIRALVTLTLLAQATGTPPARNCFEFYGFDVLLDDCLKPWLLEVNLSPALAADCEADVTVKQPMLHELFDLLGLPMRHTGLALLRGQNPARGNSFSSEDESGVPRAPPPPPKSGSRSASRTAGGRRRRRPMPIHCVTIQPPMPDDTETTEDSKEDNTESKTCAEIPYGSDVQSVQSTSSVVTPPSEPVDEPWRGGYSSAASRRRMMSACSWGNGVQWNKAVGRVGQWVRIYPHTLPNEDQIPVDVRESVAQISKYLRAAREVVREGGRDLKGPRDAGRDIAFEAALRKKLDFGQDIEVWLPPF
ncbi:probable tubulin polyglutamylase TTLL2 [Amyelois transitella]|uniref:probable tubulin polyglutamylase TTLL2 n=1 Tax=Amyelois transitella TaxID=680683 RepID=UPI002990602F|nr:probable tubulin polyglutamylase TTLL2 [Amyelois transitella]